MLRSPEGLNFPQTGKHQGQKDSAEKQASCRTNCAWCSLQLCSPCRKASLSVTLLLHEAGCLLSKITHREQPCPAPCHQEGKRRAGALCPANPGDTCPWGPAIAKPQLSCSDPPWLLPHPSWGRKGPCQGAGSVPTSLSSETELWEAGWRDEARNRCRQAWPLSLSLSSEWSQQKEHLATLALPHPACSCLSPWTYGSKLSSCIRDDLKPCC